MDVSKISPGKDVPFDINVVIEIPQGSSVKYEVDKDSGAVVVDRILFTPMAYPAAYGKDFTPPGRQTRAAWEKEREARIVGKKRITVKLSDIKVTVDGNKATARFQQAYSADALNVSSRKTLDLVQHQGRWTIVRESTGG